jgi:hypothetical protein
MPSASLGQDASLSFVVIGRGQKTKILLWERLSAAILRFLRLERLQPFQREKDLSFDYPFLCWQQYHHKG